MKTRKALRESARAPCCGDERTAHEAVLNDYAGEEKSAILLQSGAPCGPSSTPTSTPPPGGVGGGATMGRRAGWWRVRPEWGASERDEHFDPVNLGLIGQGQFARLPDCAEEDIFKGSHPVTGALMCPPAQTAYPWSVSRGQRAAPASSAGRERAHGHLSWRPVSSRSVPAKSPIPEDEGG